MIKFTCAVINIVKSRCFWDSY